MVLFTPKKLGSKKQHQILAQTAYYQAGKIVVQTILPEQPPVALITLNTLGTTCSTSADTYIPIENIFNTQSCSFLESRLVSLYGGKAASLLIEYQQRLNNYVISPTVDLLLTPSLLRTYAKQRRASVADVAKVKRALQAPSPGVSTTNPQPTSDSSSLLGTSNKSYKSASLLAQRGGVSSATCSQLRMPFGVSNGQSETSCCESSALNFVRLKAPIRCKTKKGCALYTSKQGEFPASDALQYLPQLYKSDKSYKYKSKSHTPKGLAKQSYANISNSWQSKEGLVQLRGQKLAKQKTDAKFVLKAGSKALQIKDLSNSLLPLGKAYNTETKLLNNVQSQTLNPSELTLLQNSAAQLRTSLGREWKAKNKARLVKTCFAGAGNNIFQSTLGNIEIQTATRLARIMVNYWNFYSLNKISLYSLFKKYVPAHQLNALHSKASINSINKLVNFHNLPFRSLTHKSDKSKSHTLPLRGKGVRKAKKGLAQQSSATICKNWQSKEGLQKEQHEESVTKEVETEGYAKRKHNVRVWGIKLKVKDKTPQGNIIYRVQNNLYFAIAQSKNSLKICENSGASDSSYNIQRLSIENIGNYSQLNNNNFQLINSLQFSNLQRDRFYPNWFRLYLPDMEATEFLKNVANYYFSLGLQTLTFPSTKSSYHFIPRFAYPEGVIGKLEVSIASPFLTFLNKNTQKEKYKLFIPTIISYTYCPPSILINSTSDKSINSRFAMNHLVSAAQLRTPLGKKRESDCFHESNTLLCKASTFDYYKLYPRFNNYVIINSKSRLNPRYPCTSSEANPLGKTFTNQRASAVTLPLIRAKQKRGKGLVQHAKGSAALPFVRKVVQQSVAVQLPLAKRGVQKAGFNEIGDFTLQSSVADPFRGMALQSPGIMGVDYIKNPNFTKVAKDQLDPLNVPFSLLLENQIFPLNYNGFSIVEKELLYNALVNSSFAKAFYLINQNRQLLDFLVDYLLRFQILRQHQILYLFSTLLLGCNKTA